MQYNGGSCQIDTHNEFQYPSNMGPIDGMYTKWDSLQGFHCSVCEEHVSQVLCTICSYSTCTNPTRKKYKSKFLTFEHVNYCISTVVCSHSLTEGCDKLASPLHSSLYFAYSSTYCKRRKNWSGETGNEASDEHTRYSG